MTAYRTAAPRPPDPPATIEDIIADEIRSLCVGFTPADWEVKDYTRWRLEASEKGYGDLRLWWQNFFVINPGFNLYYRRQEWRERSAAVANRASVERVGQLLGEKKR